MDTRIKLDTDNLVNYVLKGKVEFAKASAHIRCIISAKKVKEREY